MRDNVEKYLKKRAKDIAKEWENSIYETAESLCKSPIEKLFLIEWYYQIEEEKDNPDGFPNFFIQPQYKINVGNKDYIVDFLIYYIIDDNWMNKQHSYPEYHKEQALITELDSFLWHGQTPEQFENEKRRERKLQKEGWKIIRFSGREIVRDVENCVEQVIDYFDNIKPKI